MEANNIIVMDNGTVAAMGNHGDLMHQSQMYKSFINELGLRKN